ncbi:MAG: hypothetical protein M1153_01060 [Patescibacteria group bacterium]|nr:hypothetical protein [Patescibacteria group bacterium]
MFPLFISEAFVTALVGFFQLTSFLFVSSVKIDATLLALLVMSVYDKNWARRLSWLIIAAVILKFFPGFDWSLALFVLAVVAGMICIDYLPLLSIISFFIAVAISTFIVNFHFFGIEWVAVYREVLLNSAAGAAALFIANFAYGKKTIR